MKYTFQSDECMVITIPLGSLRDAQEGQLMPEKFHCVFKDVYKVFLKGQPKALGVRMANMFLYSRVNIYFRQADLWIIKIHS